MPKESQLESLFVMSGVWYEVFLRNNKNCRLGGVNQIVQIYTTDVIIHREGTHWREICCRLFLAMFKAWERCAELGISGRGGKVFSLFRHSSDDGSIETMRERGPFIVVMGEEEYGLQISSNTEDNGEKTWKIISKYVGKIVKRFIEKTPTRFPKFVPCEGFDLKSEPDEFARKLLSDYEGDDSIYSTDKKVLESIETLNNLLVHFCSGQNEISFNQDVMKMIQSELKVMMCSPEKFMTDFQGRLYKAGILKSEDFAS